MKIYFQTTSNLDSFLNLLQFSQLSPACLVPNSLPTLDFDSTHIISPSAQLPTTPVPLVQADFSLSTSLAHSTSLQLSYDLADLIPMPIAAPLPHLMTCRSQAVSFKPKKIFNLITMGGSIYTPTYNEAKKFPHWQDAMTKEIFSFISIIHGSYFLCLIMLLLLDANGYTGSNSTQMVK